MFRLDRFAPVYRALQDKGLSFVVVGGQACSLWALKYEKANPGLCHFQPYTTVDLDLCARTTQDLYDVAKALDVRPILPRKGAASPELGIVEYEIEDGKVSIQMLRQGFAVSGDEIIDRKQVYRWEEHDLVLEVMHPVLCLQEKAAAVFQQDQTERQDLKHLQMALRFVPCFITERVQDSETSEIRQMCQRVLDISEGATEHVYVRKEAYA